jgi:hypothetical protein
MVTFLIHKTEIRAAQVERDEPSMKINFESEISTSPLPLMVPDLKGGTRKGNAVSEGGDGSLPQKN